MNARGQRGISRVASPVGSLPRPERVPVAKRREVTVKQDPENPLPIEILAESIVKVSDGMKAVFDAGLTRRALVILIHDRLNGITRESIGAVLDTIPELKDHYLTPDGRARVAAARRVRM